jgi:hypothetical protein
MVYDASACGLNSVLFAPWFALPTINSMIRTLDGGYWCADKDFGEMFLNFWLHEDLKKFCGVDLTGFFPEELEGFSRKTIWLRWCRLAMGLTPSPYLAYQGALRLRESLHEDEVFAWDSVRMNLPGSHAFDPSLPWVSKIMKDGSIAVDTHIFVDDVRPTGATRELTWRASDAFGKMCSYLGLQNASRKTREPSMTPGAWAGCVVAIEKAAVYVLVTLERWKKTQRHILRLRELVDGKDPAQLKSDCVALLPHKELESIRGFLIYVSRTYPAMTTYLKGLHLTLDGWRPDRDAGGWRLRDTSALPEDWMENYPENAPTWVKPCDRLDGDVAVLETLVSTEEPPRRLVRPGAFASASYSFGDASGEGFGESNQDHKNPKLAPKPAQAFAFTRDTGVPIGGRSDVTRDEAKAVPEKVVLGLVTPSTAFSDSWSFRVPKTNVEPTKKSLRVSRLPEKCVAPTGGAGVGAQDPSIVEILEPPAPEIPPTEYRFGIWTDEGGRQQSSNHRELENLVLGIELRVRNGTLGDGTVLFLFTDNRTAEACFFNGTSGVKPLFNLIVRLRKLEMEGQLFIHVIWVAGTRMIEQGTDGLSRGDLNNGVMVGRSMLDFVPLHRTAFERSPKLQDWFASWTKPFCSQFLHHDDWFTRAHKDGTFVWAPQPAAADVMLELLCDARHTRPWNAHIVILPTLMTSRWRKQLIKVSDVNFVIPLGSDMWPKEMHESLTCALIFPQLSRSPWTFKRTRLVHDLSSDLSGVWSTDSRREGSLLRKCWSRAITLDAMPERLARDLLQTARCAFPSDEASRR